MGNVKIRRGDIEIEIECSSKEEEIEKIAKLFTYLEAYKKEVENTKNINIEEVEEKSKQPSFEEKEKEVLNKEEIEEIANKEKLREKFPTEEEIKNYILGKEEFSYTIGEVSEHFIGVRFHYRRDKNLYDAFTKRIRGACKAIAEEYNGTWHKRRRILPNGEREEISFFVPKNGNKEPLKGENGKRLGQEVPPLRG